MPDRMSEIKSDRMSEYLPVYLPVGMPERMSEEKPENMSDRMRLYMSEYVAISLPDWNHSLCQIQCQNKWLHWFWLYVLKCQGVDHSKWSSSFLPSFTGPAQVVTYQTVTSSSDLHCSTKHQVHVLFPCWLPQASVFIWSYIVAPQAWLNTFQTHMQAYERCS